MLSEFLVPQFRLHLPSLLEIRSLATAALKFVTIISSSIYRVCPLAGSRSPPQSFLLPISISFSASRSSPSVTGFAHASPISVPVSSICTCHPPHLYYHFSFPTAQLLPFCPAHPEFAHRSLVPSSRLSPGFKYTFPPDCSPVLLSCYDVMICSVYAWCRMYVGRSYHTPSYNTAQPILDVGSFWNA